MAKGIKIEIKGLKELNRKLNKLAKQAPRIVARELFRFAEEKIANRSRKEFVPVMTGALKTSIITQLPVVMGSKVSVIVGAGSSAVKYALSVHENPRAGKTGGVSPQGKRYSPFLIV